MDSVCGGIVADGDPTFPFKSTTFGLLSDPDAHAGLCFLPSERDYL